jgi:tRNA pseudouridine55 synthase
MEGLILIDKPADWTSFDAVNFVRRIVAQLENKKPKNVKLGHTGTLDPFATGLLILLVGKAYTKRAGEFSKLDKTYDLIMKLGQTSSTGDSEGEIEEISDCKPALSRVQEILDNYRGEIDQVPPAFSAIKVNGQRAYKLARSGLTPVLEPRKVTIYKLELLSYDYPDIELRATVSSGTYIRSLVKDIGRDLQVGAYTKDLRRLQISSYNVENAIGPKELTSSNIEQYIFKTES